MLYKVIYWRPVVQEGGTYELYQDEYWVSNAHLRSLKKILECTGRDSGMDHLNYFMAIEVPPGTPLHGRWGYKFVMYPVNNGTPETPYTGWVAGDQDQDLSVAFEIEQILAAWAEQDSGEHFSY